MKRNIGLDFGTTNSAVASSSPDGVALAHYPHLGGTTDTFRSVLYFHPERRGREGELVPLAGPLGIEQYLGAHDGRGRLIQSLKSYLADRLFEATNIFGRAFTLHDLLRLLLTDLRAQAERDLGPLGSRVVVGRPVRFAQGETDVDDARAIARLRAAFAGAGWDEVTFVEEPVAAAHFYERRLDHDEVVLVGDFGGGTSDFTLAKVGPTRRREQSSGVLATSGVAVAGDAIDARIVDNVVAPAVGKGSRYRSMFGKELDVPVWLFMKLRRWHHLSFLNTKPNLELLDTIIRSSTARDAIQALRDIIDNEEGYSLYRAVERAKIDLSRDRQARFSFEGASATIERDITREELEGWIAEETAAMGAAVSRVMDAAALSPGDVNRVFLTGGTSFVPAVRRIFEERFGAERIEVGGEMISVASGLALMAAEG